MDPIHWTKNRFALYAVIGRPGRPPVSFVWVTLPFNTATSMGRLVLHVLLSFAQFERPGSSKSWW